MFFTKTQSKAEKYASASYSLGLKDHFIRVYNFMAMALTITGAVSLGVSKSAAIMNALFANPFMMIVLMLLPIGISIFMGMKMETLSLNALTGCLVVYAALIGLTLAPIFLIYTHSSIARIFFISAYMVTRQKGT